MRTPLLSPVLIVIVVAAGCTSVAPASAEPSASPSAVPSGAPSAEPPGIGVPASFWIEPASLPLDPAATTISGVIRERECASGQSPDGRILQPDVVYGPDAITVTVSVTPREGDQDCQGNPEVPITVTLTEPIGDRQVLDGSAEPPRDATTLPG